MNMKKMVGAVALASMLTAVQVQAAGGCPAGGFGIRAGVEFLKKKYKASPSRSKKTRGLTGEIFARKLIELSRSGDDGKTAVNQVSASRLYDETGSEIVKKVSEENNGLGDFLSGCDKDTELNFIDEVSNGFSNMSKDDIEKYASDFEVEDGPVSRDRQEEFAGALTPRAKCKPSNFAVNFDIFYRVNVGDTFFSPFFGFNASGKKAHMESEGFRAKLKSPFGFEGGLRSGLMVCQTVSIFGSVGACFYREKVSLFNANGLEFLNKKKFSFSYFLGLGSEAYFGNGMLVGAEARIAPSVRNNKTGIKASSYGFRVYVGYMFGNNDGGEQ